MKTLCLIFLFIPFNFFGQEVYYSFLTETYPNIYRSEFKLVDRRIVFEPNDVTIVTETNQGKDIEVLNIQETQVLDDRLTLICENRNKHKITIVFPKEQEEFLYIDYYYRSLLTNEEIQLRLHVEEMQNGPEDSIGIGDG
ncbi:hypothetical protein LDL76_08775 [Salegentibacter mishustinae]|uniref:hypothetical protein n=1 Tax=Salegentibacter mishustinae TaxID=270918 RepID=UPI001CE13B47|nr:hypothetical protein [Salegentibacter mishustinae]UBZ08790.1 hypothetical protein LDL76_08775 [Salegentibacter mishustinae]